MLADRQLLSLPRSRSWRRPRLCSAATPAPTC